jgi:membrane protease YdiL (CAAX protease family)
MLEPYFRDNPKDSSAKYDLLAAYLMHGDYRKAAKLYPIAFNVAAVLLALGFVAGSAVLLRKSFQPSINEHPHLAFAIAWLVLYFETQIALVFYAGLFTDAKLIAGLLVAPLPLFVAAFGAFPRQLWGKPFTPPDRVAAKQIGTAFVAWIATLFIAGIYMTVLTKFTHYKPEARNVRFVMEIVREHRALAAIVVVFLAPMSEEILFRGLLFGALRKWLNPKWTIVITALVFASIHLDVYYLLPIFLLGLVLGWARHTANSIWFSTAIHILQNGIAFTAISMS